MRPLVSFVLLALLVSPAISAAEVQLAEPTIVPANTESYTRSDARVAAGDGFLVLWEEHLFGAYPSAVMVRAYDDAGQPRRAVATPLNSIAYGPRAVWTGSDYLVVGAPPISRFGATAPIPVVVAMRVRADGTLVEGSQVTLAEGKQQAGVISLAWNGREALAYFYTSDGRRLLLLNAEGRVVEDRSIAVRPQAPVMIAAAPDSPQYSLFAETGDVAAVAPGAVAVIDNTSLGAIVTLMNASGEKQEAFLLTPNSVRSIVWDGSAWLAAYATATSVCTARFTHESNVARDCSVEIAPQIPSIAAGRARSFRAWARGVEQVETDSGVASLVRASQIFPSATVGPNGLTVAWVEAGRIRLGSGQFVDEAHDVRFARVAGSLLVWTTEGGKVFAKRIDAPGNAIELGAGTNVTAASNGDGVLVAWQQGYEVVSTFVSANGDPNGLEHFGGAEIVRQFRPRVAATPNGFVIVWSESEPMIPRERERVVAERLDVHGARVSGGVRLYDADGTGGPGLNPEIGCGPQGCLIVFRDTMAIAIGHDAQPHSEVLKIIGGGDAPKTIVPRENGTFDVYGSAAMASVRGDATTISYGEWTTGYVAFGAVVPFEGKRIAVYSRDGRVVLRDLATRGRAARH